MIDERQRDGVHGLVTASVAAGGEHQDLFAGRDVTASVTRFATAEQAAELAAAGSAF